MYLPDYTAGSLIHFDLESVVCPDFTQVVDKITKCLEISGRIIFLSDAGEKRDHFAVVQVEGVMSPLIVPVDSIKSCSSVSYDEGADAARD